MSPFIKIVIIGCLAWAAFYPDSSDAGNMETQPMGGEIDNDSVVDAPADGQTFTPNWEEAPVPIPSWIDQTKNNIQYPEHLQSFWTKLQDLSEGKRDQVRILHIGDSHLQAGIFSGKLQRFLCARYGNAGRGLVFPYQLAKTNPTPDISSSSNLTWEKQMNISYSHSLPVGLGGFSVKTTNSGFQLRFKIKENYSKEFAFDKITLFAPAHDKTFGIAVGEGWLEEKPADAKFVPLHADNNGIATVFFDAPRYDFTIFGHKSEAQQTEFLLQGIVLENSRQRGILYNMVGVNGATYGAYNRSADFIRQATALEPDLIIISLGTNEAVDAHFQSANMGSQMDKLLTHIQQQTACDAILLMSANDILIKGAETAHPAQVATLMQEKSQTYKTAVWDFYALMGGKGSIKTWKDQALAQSDYIHLSPKGYEVQAQLLFDALLAAAGQ